VDGSFVRSFVRSQDTVGHIISEIRLLGTNTVVFLRNTTSISNNYCYYNLILPYFLNLCLEHTVEWFAEDDHVGDVGRARGRGRL